VTPQEELETEEVGLFKELEDLRDLLYQQQLQVYLDMLPRQVDPALAAATPIMEYLKTEVAYKVFVYNPDEWTGINGIDPVELKFREDMQERMPSKARPIPAKLIEQAKPEFDKLFEYYLTPCTSPCTTLTYAQAFTRSSGRVLFTGTGHPDGLRHLQPTLRARRYQPSPFLSPKDCPRHLRRLIGLDDRDL
jgi:hypothetical protein